ncbi:hypothetical protein [Rhodococcus koreensis]|uniref:Uncharacterized protein n=1 Tax=Rhodococcus koreensis TaxID=99653 RepID=A0A1H4M624_9NOCA|nr:hypothetical protein [Rhodococcus koreensis]SEB78393.1 hypothetical protein SAMN04490239_1648 [Rhodococcus koreensis]
MNSIDTFNTTALESMAIAEAMDSDVVFVDIEETMVDKHRARRSVMPTAYTLHPNEVIGEFGERRCAREDRVTGRIL